MSAGDHPFLVPSTPHPNALPPADPTWPSLILSAVHPQLLILYGYFAIIATLLYRVIAKSIFAERLSGHERILEAGVWSLLAAVSLGSTWTFMFRYFSTSFESWLAQADLTSLGVPAIPTCQPESRLITGILTSSPCHLSLAATHLQRFSLWLTNTSLFLEAWNEVVKNEANYWWSLEVCLFTVGAWTVFLRTQRRRLSIPQLWAYMLLGQTVAISFAACLFNLALALRPIPDGSLVQRAGLQSASPEERSPGQIVQVKEVIILPDDEGAGEGYSGTARQTIERTTITQHLVEAPSTHPSLPSRVLLWTFTLLAALSLKDRPNTALSIVIMHLLPLALTLPQSWLHSLEDLFDHLAIRPRPDSEDEAAEHASNARVQGILRPSRLLGLLSVWGLAMRAYTTLSLLHTLKQSLTKYEQIQLGELNLLRNLVYPTTFYSHPAQSSISSDAVCIVLITMTFIGLDVLRLPKSITRSPALQTVVKGKAIPTAVPTKSSLLLQWYLPAVILFLTTPFLGAMTTFPAWLSVREYHLEEAEMEDERRLRAEAGHGVGLVVQEKKEEMIIRYQKADRG